MFVPCSIQILLPARTATLDQLLFATICRVAQELPSSTKTKWKSPVNFKVAASPDCGGTYGVSAHDARVKTAMCNAAILKQRCFMVRGIERVQGVASYRRLNCRFAKPPYRPDPATQMGGHPFDGARIGPSCLLPKQYQGRETR
jgi:hypothetical protein